ncbi:type IX secretion system periplasmic lipoprotein PorW/SprE [Wenyingzhuangia sp. IMCC45533]
MKHLVIYLLLVISLVSCSTRKDRFLNRKYHALVTKFNVYYNGKVAYDKGLGKVEQTFVDDYRDILPIEPFSFYAQQDLGEEVAPIGQEDFERAEEKAVKAIQKHSMLIAGEERNSQIDEAYLLLGKSRYYTKRFGPALEAFEYIIRNYPSASLIYETVIWRAKSNIHLGNTNFGKKALERLLKSPKLTPEARQQAEIGVVMALEKNKDSLEPIIEHLENALNALERGSVASRVAFILGQAYAEQGDVVASDKAFDRAIEMPKGLYKFKIQAKLEKINNHLDELSTEEFLKKINRLIFVTKNRPYIGALLYEKGLIYEATDSITQAKQFFTQSIQSSIRDVNQIMLSYEKLGDISYDEKKYPVAKSYYDSLVDVAQNKKSKTVVRIKRKSKSLEKVVGLASEAKANDSLLMIAAFTEDKAKLFFEDYIEKIKEEEKRQRIKELRELAKQNRIAFDDNSDWYFYNNTQRTKGKDAFLELWQVTTRSKNWYAKSLNRKRILEEVENDTLSTEKIEISNKYEVAYYLDRIDRSPRFLDSIAKSRNLNYYELGNAYYSQLGEKDLAVEKLKDLVNFNPRKDLTIGAFYRLFKIYNESGEVANANVYKQKLLSEFPNSSFAHLVANDNSESEAKNIDAYQECYQIIYDLYTVNSIAAAQEEMRQALQSYGDSPLAAKYALLNAYLQAKTKGQKAFNQLLKEIKLRYPNTVEAKKAEELLNNGGAI